MTDNEKAATFIGWAPGQMCACITKPLDDREFGDVWCPSCNEVFGCGNHDIVCPDMSDPRHYMKALATLVERGLEPLLDHDGKEWTLWMRETKGVERSALRPEDAIIHTLAALYDIDHSGNAVQVNATT